MKYIRTFFSILLAATFVISCASSKKDYKTEYNRKDSIVFYANLIPYRVDKLGTYDSIVVGFAPFAARFFLHKKLPNSKKYVRLLNDAMTNNTPVKVYLFRHTNKIGMITNASLASK